MKGQLVTSIFWAFPSGRAIRSYCTDLSRQWADGIRCYP